MQHKAYTITILELSEQTVGDRHLLLVERHPPSEIKAGVCKTKHTRIVMIGANQNTKTTFEKTQDETVCLQLSRVKPPSAETTHEQNRVFSPYS